MLNVYVKTFAKKVLQEYSYPSLVIINSNALKLILGYYLIL